MTLLVRIWQEKEHTLRAVASAVLHQPQLIDDVMQEAFSRLLKRNRAFRSQAEAFCYIRTTVLNTAIDFYRRMKRQARILRDEPAEDYYTASHSEDPLGILIREQEEDTRSRVLQEVRDALGNLPASDREAIDAFFGPRRGRTLKQYCGRKGVSYSTLRGRMLRGVDRIREHLRERGVEGFDPPKER